jgi:hypothetical protein
MGEGQVARSEAAMDMAGGKAFAEGLGTSVVAMMQEKEKNDAILDAAMIDLGGVQNINKLDQGYNKQAVTDFVRTQRGKYAELSKAYQKSKDPNILDQMEAIKFSFNNLNTQLDLLVGERKEYLDAYDKGQLVHLKKDGKYVMAYTNKGQFGVGENGDIGFNVDGEYSNFKDMAGKWNTKNNISETYILEQNLNARELGEKGKAFYRNDIKNLYAANFESTGPEGMQVMAKTDMTGDNEYELPNGQKAGNMSFESMWSQGILDEKFYKQIPKGTDSEWMYDRKNKDILKSMMSEYYTDVTEFSYGQGKANYKDPNAGKGKDKSKQTKHTSGITDSVYIGGSKRHMKAGEARKLWDNISGGNNFRWDGGKTYYDYTDGAWHKNDEKIGEGTADDLLYDMGLEHESFTGMTTERKEYIDSEGNEDLGGVDFQGLTTDNFIGDDDVLAKQLNSLIPKESAYAVVAAPILDANYVKITYNGKTVKKIPISNRKDLTDKELLNSMSEFETFFSEKDITLGGQSSTTGGTGDWDPNKY